VKALAAQNRCGGLAAFTTDVSGTPQVVVSYETTAPAAKLEAYSAAGGAAIATATPASFLDISAGDGSVQWGSPSAERLYIADGAGVWRWSGAAFSQPAGIGGSFHLAVKPNSNRLVTVDTSDTNKVKFSNAGDPETFGVNNYVDLAPGDGSGVTGLATWQDRVYAFKTQRFFVFGTEATDSAGNPVFNYYAVDGYGALVPPAAGEEGVYFFDGRRIWVVGQTGGVPQRISAPIEPYIAGIVSLNSATGHQSLLESARLRYTQGRLWFSIYNTVSETTTFIFDPKTSTWTVSSLKVTGVATGYQTGQPRTYWTVDNTTVAATALSIYRVDATTTTDAGTAISWNWTSGLYSPANDPGRIAISLESQLVGSGTVTMQVATTGGAGSSSGALDTGSAVTLGVAPTLSEGWQQIDREGKYWSHKLSGTGSAVVAELSHFLSFIKPPGVW
jgi:hypothetical protein